MLTRKSGMLALVLGVAVLGGVACEEDTQAPIPPTPVVVNVSPDNVPPIDVGATVQLVAVVTGSTNQAVTWASSNNAVATVNASGLVTGVAQGVATITATSAADPNARDAVSIQVQPAAPPPPPPVITLQSINVNCAGAPGCVPGPVNPGNVQGRVDVIANVDIAAGVQVARIETLVDGTVVCTQTVAGGGEADAEIAAVPVPVNCGVNTAQLNADGTPVFANGTHTFTVRAVGPTGTVLATATSAPHIFANVNFLAVTYTAFATGATATDNAGLVWSTGDLVVNVQPGIFTGGAVSSVTVSVYDDLNGLIAQRTVSTAGANNTWTATFTKAVNTTSGLLDVSEAEGTITVLVTSIQSGQPGPTFGTAAPGLPLTPTLRLDNDAPDTEAPDPAATFIIPQDAICLASASGIADPNSCNWFSAGETLTMTSRVANSATLDDEGVNVNTVKFEFNTNLAATNTSSGWTAFTTPTELPQTITSQGFRVRAVVCDKLNNCTNILSAAAPAGAAGGDVTAPTFADATAAPDSIDEAQGDAGTEIDLGSIAENLSGFPDLFVRVRIVRTLPAGTACIDPATGAASAVPSGGCAFVGQNATSVNIPAAAGDGYFEVTVQLVDNAGNTSTQLTKLFLVDSTAPAATVTSVAFASGQVTVGGTATDNVEVAAWDVRLTFPTFVTSFPFTTRTAAGTFGLPLTNSVAVSGSAPLIREINGNALSNLGFGVYDLANNYADGALPFGSPTPGDGIDNGAVIIGGAPQTVNSGATLCRTGTNPPCTGAGGVPATTVTSRTVTWTLVTGPNTANPISTVYFYAFVPTNNAGLKLILIGSDATGDLSITDPVTNNRNWAYSIELSASILPPVPNPGATYQIFTHAVAVDPEGDGIHNTAGSGPITVY